VDEGDGVMVLLAGSGLESTLAGVVVGAQADAPRTVTKRMIPHWIRLSTKHL
jgi:hypothetical protein